MKTTLILVAAMFALGGCVRERYGREPVHTTGVEIDVHADHGHGRGHDRDHRDYDRDRR